MSWITIAIIAYLLFAVVNLADKFLLKQVIPTAKTYAFLVGISGFILFVLAPWFLEWPGLNLFLLNILVGAFFVLALLFIYTALRDTEASRIYTLTGGAVPVLIVIFSLIFFQESFTGYQWLSIFFLVLGTIYISRVSEEHSILFRVKEWMHMKSDARLRNTAYALMSAVFFALFWIGTKYAYNTQPFSSALLWIRLGSFITAILLLIRLKDRQSISADLKQSNQKKNNKFIFLTTMAIGGLAAILQNYAVSLGSVALITSLQGIQYAILLILGVLVTIFYPKAIKENITKNIIMQKIIAIVLISIGLYFLAI